VERRPGCYRVVFIPDCLCLATVRSRMADRPRRPHESEDGWSSG
jgi:hypothetical protein